MNKQTNKTKMYKKKFKILGLNFMFIISKKLTFGL